ncbi:baseplate J/gp47 family protein [Metaclostridioides mangenotii]|uniref:baseplate J/gp47 family protein n=1 Tax=Metaclostridioides mangenotii TaxID=1540 RepID=UPI0028EFE915|nr:baseplate J/gp47 family protein [Clostridioides mangenotii]
MFEDKTFENILDGMLSNVPQDIDKREGSIIYDALAPTAMELANAYINLNLILDETFADTASRFSLIKRCKERGIEPLPSTYAIGKGVFNMDVPLRWRFSLDDLNFFVTEKIDDNVYKLQCEQTGDIGNVAGTLVPIDYLEGLQTAELTEILLHGEDEEETEALRGRYFNSLNSQAFGGNTSDYKERVRAIQDVGGVKVFPVWNGGGTVKIVFTNRFSEVPESSLVEYVQNELDPIGYQGQGKGIAPIGHIVTVEGATAESITIETKLTYQADWSWEDVKPAVTEAIKDYFSELNQGWEELNSTVVRISQIETRLLNIEGLIDIEGTKINSLEKNYIVSENSIVTLGSVGEIVE